MCVHSLWIALVEMQRFDELTSKHNIFGFATNTQFISALSRCQCNVIFLSKSRAKITCYFNDIQPQIIQRSQKILNLRQKQRYPCLWDLNSDWCMAKSMEYTCREVIASARHPLNGWTMLVHTSDLVRTGYGFLKSPMATPRQDGTLSYYI